MELTHCLKGIFIMVVCVVSKMYKVKKNLFNLNGKIIAQEPHMEYSTSEQRRKIMRAIKSTNTKDEIVLSKSLWHLGYRYRRNSKYIYGKPDISFKKYKIAIFVDGEFFHGKDWDTLKKRLNNNKEFWHKKIERNMERDREVNKYLQDRGWTVIRFWCKEIKSNLNNCIKIIEGAIYEAKKI